MDRIKENITINLCLNAKVDCDNAKALWAGIIRLTNELDKRSWGAWVQNIGNYRIHIQGAKIIDVF